MVFSLVLCIHFMIFGRVFSSDSFFLHPLHSLICRCDLRPICIQLHRKCVCMQTRCELSGMGLIFWLQVSCRSLFCFSVANKLFLRFSSHLFPSDLFHGLSSLDINPSPMMCIALASICWQVSCSCTRYAYAGNGQRWQQVRLIDWNGLDWRMDSRCTEEEWKLKFHYGEFSTIS